MTKEAARWLRVVRLLHTAAWAVFAGCIVAIPVFAWQGRFGGAARYTDDRRANFDIYLTEWLARYNQPIFGTLYVAGVAYFVALYLRVG